MKIYHVIIWILKKKINNFIKKKQTEHILDIIKNNKTILQ